MAETSLLSFGLSLGLTGGAIYSIIVGALLFLTIFLAMLSILELVDSFKATPSKIDY